ncbi:hypothetical protein M2267_001359 [Ensifer sp. KUDG1]|uniref:DUF1272 domain-containing protein n=1 Tax=Ensifer sp. KUDG1 TaxID=3373919 RepID=UPI003D193DD6
MLELRPNCELCDRDLPPASLDARICSYECTYCASCVETVLHNVCPTCGGGFAPRPIRPLRSFRPQKRLGLGFDPASEVRRHSPYTAEDIQAHVARIRHLAPNER